MKIFYNKGGSYFGYKKGLPPDNLPVEPEIRAVKEFDDLTNFSPESLINAGEHVFEFIVSEDIAEGILAAAIWEEVIRKSFHYLKKNKKDSSDTLAIITDEYKTSEFKKTICFVFYAHQSEREIRNGLKKIPEVRKRLLHLLKIVDIKTRNKTLRLTFKKDRWVVDYNSLPEIVECE